METYQGRVCPADEYKLFKGTPGSPSDEWSFPTVKEIAMGPGWVPSEISVVDFLSDKTDSRLQAIAEKLGELNRNPSCRAWEAVSYTRESVLYFALRRIRPQPHRITRPKDWERPKGALVYFPPNIPPGSQALLRWPRTDMGFELI